MDEETNIISSNVVYNVVRSLAVIIFPLLVFPYVSRILGVEGIGKFSFSSSIINYISTIASLGISTYAVRECSKSRNEKEKLGQVASELISLNVCSTIISLIILLILINLKTFKEYRILLLMQSITVISTTFGADWLNMAVSDFRYITVRTIIFQILSLLLIFIFVRKSTDYYTYALILILSSSGASLVNFMYRRRFCKTRVVFNTNILSHFKYVLPFFFSSLAQAVYVNGGTTMLGLMSNDYEVGIFSVSHKIYSIVNSLVSSIAIVMIPSVSIKYAQGKYEEMNDSLVYAFKFIVCFGCPCIIGLNSVCRELIFLFSGKSFAGSIIVLRILTIAMFFSFLGGFIGSIYLVPIGKEKFCLKASILAAIVCLISCFLFIPRLKAIGAAISISLAEIISFFFLCKKSKIHLNFKSRDKRLFFVMIIGDLLIVIVFLFCNYILKIENLFFSLLIKLVLSIFSYFGVLFLSKDEFVYSFVRKVKRKN